MRSKLSGRRSGVRCRKTSDRIADEHEGRAGHGVDEELHGRVDPVAVAPAADEEVHRAPAMISKHHEEQEQVEGQEGADAAASSSSIQAM